jgi:ABC-2 type transport system ATP-binding protein
VNQKNISPGSLSPLCFENQSGEDARAKEVMSVIEARQLTRRFARVNALQGLDLDISPGSVYALVGSNGAGKSTLIKILMNIVRPTSGRAKVLGYDSLTVSGKVFEKIGYVSENQKLPDWMTPRDLFAYLRPFYSTWDTALEADLVRQFDLPLNRKLKGLSRGMRMKAAIASALAFHPQLIVLDEPFSGLDPLVRDELVGSLIARTGETTVLISSHDLAEVESFATHVGYLEQGTLRFSEELSSLLGRFRAVQVNGIDSLPDRQPGSWLQPSVGARMARYTVSDFDPQQTPAETKLLFPAAESIDYLPMSLREVFLVMAKSGRASGEERAL